MSIVREAIGYHMQLPTHLVIFGQDSMKEKKRKRVVKGFMKSNLENPQDIKKFALLVSLMLKDGNTIECPRQEGVIECRYFVMRYIKEIIDDPTLIISKVCT
ncbi:hypothetical protein CK203_051669 [Vitis vinifera]|uniref:Uncharacterized protein n=1 Tax=Vitis vinifera TaxID=29760 RepID=A0A438H5I5_VITVI|nr:hypothetical protein CK203_051669 [Vitis vinifera]